MTTKHTNEWRRTCMVDGGSTLSVAGEDNKGVVQITISENGGPRDDVRTATLTMSVGDWNTLVLDVRSQIDEASDDPRG